MSAPDNRVHIGSPTQHRFHLLDAIRGIAALLVVAYHAPPDFGRLVPFRSGFLAVDLFFALSGFVIAFSYERRLLEGMPYRNFVVTRLIRLYPVYLISTVFAVVIGVAVAHMLSAPTLPLQLLLALLLLPDLLHGGRGIMYPLDFPAWSLLCELLSNIGYGALLFWRQAGRWLLYLCLSGCAAYMVTWVYHAGTVDSGSVLQTFPMGLARVGIRSRQVSLSSSVFKRSDSIALQARPLICWQVFSARRSSLRSPRGSRNRRRRSWLPCCCSFQR